MKNFLIIALSVFCLSGLSQSVSTEKALAKLKPFWNFSESIRMQIQDTTKQEWKSVIEQSYNFIILEVRRDISIFLRVEYQLQQKELKIYDFYCANKKLEKKLKKECQIFEKPFDWHAAPKDSFKLSQDFKNYLEIADRIAEKGNDISAHPTNFGRIILRKDHVKLLQNNHRNSRSLDHKDSYFMRDLSFKIHYQKQVKKKLDPIAMGRYFIGEMEVIFYDGSAKSQREAGNRIQKQIDEEIENFKGNKE